MIEIYTDGACRGNPGRGGWAALLLLGEHEREISGAEEHTTNNRMELTAVIRALEALKRPVQARVYTDSEYVRRGVTEWLAAWKARGWRTADRKPVKNQTDMQALGRIVTILLPDGTPQEQLRLLSTIAGVASGAFENLCWLLSSSG